MRGLSHLRDRVRNLTPRQILVLGYAMFFVYAFPGYMSTDSASQLGQSRYWVFSDAHPPLMALEWGLFDRIVSGPLLMLLAQSLLFLVGVFVLAGRIVPARTAAWTAIGILLFPPILTPMAVVWKDSQMAACLVAGTAAMLSPRLRIRIGGLALLAAAAALRHNAFGAVVPLVFFMFEWRPGIRWWKRIAILIAAATTSVALACGVTRVIAVQHVVMTPAMQDIIGVLAFTKDRSDEDLRHVFRGTTLAVERNIQGRARMLYELGGVWRVTSTEDRLFGIPTQESEWTALNRAWKELVLDDPAAYLESHWYRFADVIGYSDEPPRATVWNVFLEMPEQAPLVEHDASHSWLQEWIGRVLYWLSDCTPLFRPYVYGLIAILLLVLACRDRVTLALYASGLLYQATFFMIIVEPDYRYSHWMVTSTCIATVLLFLRRVGKGKP